MRVELYGCQGKINFPLFQSEAVCNSLLKWLRMFSATLKDRGFHTKKDFLISQQVPERKVDSTRHEKHFLDAK